MKNINKVKGDHSEYVYVSNSIIKELETINMMGDWDGSLEDIFRDIKMNYKIARDISIRLYNLNGMFTNTINYLAGLYTYDHFIYPNFKANLDDTSSNFKKLYFDSAKLLDKMNVKETFLQVMLTVLVEGMGFYYEVSSPNKENFKKLPYDFCKITYSEGGVCRYAVNLSMIHKGNINRFPKEIKKAWVAYIEDPTNKPSWYQVSNKGVAFTTDDTVSNGLPYFTFLVDTLDRYEKAKERSDRKDDLDILKLVHQKIPVDPKTMKPAIPPKMAEVFHEATKSNLPSSVAITTNPLDINSISFDKTNANDNDIIERATKELWNNSGLSNQLFNNTNNSAEALRKNVIVNQILLKRFLNSFTIYLNTKLVSKKFSVSFLPITEMNRKESLELATKSLGFGGSRLLALAAQGLTPLQAIHMLELEQNVLSIDDIMIPKDTSYTLSPDSGRPLNEDIDVDDSESREDAKNRGDE